MTTTTSPLTEEQKAQSQQKAFELFQEARKLVFDIDRKMLHGRELAVVAYTVAILQDSIETQAPEVVKAARTMLEFYKKQSQAKAEVK